MHPLTIAVGIVISAIFLLLADTLSSFFGATQIQIVYIAIVIFAGSIVAGAFGRH